MILKMLIVGVAIEVVNLMVCIVLLAGYKQYMIKGRIHTANGISRWIERLTDFGVLLASGMAFVTIAWGLLNILNIIGGK